MKKIFLSLGCLLFLPVAGCATSNENNALITLNNQLDRVESVVSSTTTTEVNSVSPYISNPNQENELSMLKTEAYLNMTSEESLRQNVLSLTSKLKKKDTKYKLSRQKASALNSLSSDLSKYLNYLNNTKSDIKHNVSKIKKSSSTRSYNEELTKSSYISLSNLMNERYIYLENIYCSLSQINIILENSITNDISCENTGDCEENTQRPVTVSRFRPNIDTYIKNSQNPHQSNNVELERVEEKGIEEKEIEEKENVKNIDTMQNTPTNKAPIVNPPVNNFAPNMYGYNNGYNFSPYTTPFAPLNSGRNTDTFYPYMRNIDTYRFSPNYYGNGYNGFYNYGYNSQIAPPQQNLVFKEQTEEIKEVKDEDDDNHKEIMQDEELENIKDITVKNLPTEKEIESNENLKDEDLTQNMMFSTNNNEEEKRQVI